MTPRFIPVTRWCDEQVIMINPRRLNQFAPVKPPTQQPDLKLGTLLDFGGREHMVVTETVAEIVKMLK